MMIKSGYRCAIKRTAYTTLYPCISSKSMNETDPWYFTAVLCPDSTVSWVRINKETKTTDFAKNAFFKSIDVPCGIKSELRRGEKIERDGQTIIIVRAGLTLRKPIKTDEDWSDVTVYHLTFAKSESGCYILLYTEDKEFEEITTSVHLSKIFKSEEMIFM